jgi:hypothetical protein
MIAVRRHLPFFRVGALAEIFLHSDSAAKESAVGASIALQHGVPVTVIRRAVLRDARGVASSPLGTTPDLVSAREGTP